MKCSIDNGYKVPEDISFIGFDDVEIARMYNPTLTTIHQPFEEKGLQATKKIINMIKDQNDKKVSEKSDIIVLPHELIVRQSTVDISS